MYVRFIPAVRHHAPLRRGSEFTSESFVAAYGDSVPSIHEPVRIARHCMPARQDWLPENRDWLMVPSRPASEEHGRAKDGQDVVPQECDLGSAPRIPVITFKRQGPNERG